jgi:acyl-CoA synthetase (AMP-forming)/AMP-acid ligase II
MKWPFQRKRDTVPPTIVSLLGMRAEQQAHQIAYTFISDSGEQGITYAELDRRARSIAHKLAELSIQGKRAMLIYPPGIDYIAAFYGCLYAGVIAVPACPPDPLRLDRSLSYLVAVVRDAMPSIVLTTVAMAAALGSLSGNPPELSQLLLITTSEIPDVPSGAAEPDRIDTDSVALLQYTSGTTTAGPRAAVLTHRYLMRNSELIFNFLGHSTESRSVNWLPPWHGMGLVGGIVQPLYGGFPATLMAPADFMRRPLRWLEAISRTQATTSGAPNFAYDLCVQKTTAEERRRLDLSSWQVAFNGAEPIRAETMENFSRAFAVAGFRRAAFHPSYGLAEAALIVTGGIPWSGRSTKSFDVTALRSGTAMTGARDATSRRLVSSGMGATGRQVVIVDPATGVECATGRVGEIWIARRDLALSYWRRPAETRETFAAQLADTGEGPFIRSGDLGFVLDRQLFVTGRIEDLIVMRGSRHHPQDIEATAELSSQVLRRGCGAAFAMPAGGRELLVIAYEITRQASQVQVADVAAAIRGAVAGEHEVQVHQVILLPPGGIPKTSDGKVQRGLCAAMFADGRLAELGRSAAPSTARAGDLHRDEPGLLSPAAADRTRAAASDRDTVRLYRWVSGSRVPVHAAGPVFC